MLQSFTLTYVVIFSHLLWYHKKKVKRKHVIIWHILSYSVGFSFVYLVFKQVDVCLWCEGRVPSSSCCVCFMYLVIMWSQFWPRPLVHSLWINFLHLFLSLHLVLFCSGGQFMVCAALCGFIFVFPLKCFFFLMLLLWCCSVNGPVHVWVFLCWLALLYFYL